MLFLIWFCSPLPWRGLLVRARFLVKGRVCRSPFCVEFLTLHPSLFAVVTHSPNFMILLTPPHNVGKHSLSKQITGVLSLQSSLLLCISVRMRFCSKEDLGFLLIAFSWYCPVLLLLVENVFAFQQSDWAGSECSYQQEYLGSVFQWNQERNDPKITLLFWRERTQQNSFKRKKMSPRS